MEAPLAWQEFLQRLASARPWEDVSEFNEFADRCQRELPALLRFSSVPEPEWRREIALVGVLRAFLSVLPSGIFEYPHEPCRPLIENRLHHMLGSAPNSSDVDLVLKVVKRAQLYYREGRASARFTRLDLSQIRHRKLLQSQSYRCANCGYMFSAGDVEPDPSSGQLPRLDTPVSAIDRSPRRIRRRAVLDHRLPVYIAGDEPTNWQILCWSCNNGKSDMLLGFESRSWFGRARLGEMVKVRAELFYMILRRDGRCNSCFRGSQQAELRLVRKDENGPSIYPNLMAWCTTCFRTRVPQEFATE
jgi:hypothetical protein